MKLQCIYMYQHYYFWGEAFKHLCVHHCMYSLRDAIIVNFEPGNGELWLRSWHHLHTHYGDASFPSTSWNICSICLFFFFGCPIQNELFSLLLVKYLTMLSFSSEKHTSQIFLKKKQERRLKLHNYHGELPNSIFRFALLCTVLQLGNSHTSHTLAALLPTRNHIGWNFISEQETCKEKQFTFC